MPYRERHIEIAREKVQEAIKALRRASEKEVRRGRVTRGGDYSYVLTECADKIEAALNRHLP